MSSESDRLHTLQSELESALEHRITELLTHVKATQAITAQLATTQQEIRVQERLKEQLSAELQPLSEHATALEGDAEKLADRIDKLKENILRMKTQRKGLVEKANALAAEARAAGKS